MADLFETKNIKPMLIGKDAEAFNDDGYIFELKLDGERCIAYLDSDKTELRNKRNVKMLTKVPELSELHKSVKKKCILDGELIVIKDGKPSFSEILARSLMSNTFKIELASKRQPATFVAYDILYLKDEQITNMPLMQRKKLLEKNVKKESERFAISRYIEGQGVELYEMAKQQDLEGVVAKRKESKYYFDKRTTEWIKIKYLKDDDYIVCGYIYKETYIVSLVLGQYQGSELIYRGHVTIGKSREEFKMIESLDQQSEAPFKTYPKGSGNAEAVWLNPELVCVVEFMEKSSRGGLRQPVFRGLKLDKLARECVMESD